MSNESLKTFVETFLRSQPVGLQKIMPSADKLTKELTKAMAEHEDPSMAAHAVLSKIMIAHKDNLMATPGFGEGLTDELIQTIRDLDLMGEGTLISGLFKNEKELADDVVNSYQSEASNRDVASMVIDTKIHQKMHEFQQAVQTGDLMAKMARDMKDLVGRAVSGKAVTVDDIKRTDFWREMSQNARFLLPMAGGEELMNKNLEAMKELINASKSLMRNSRYQTDTGIIQSIMRTMVSLDTEMVGMARQEAVEALTETLNRATTLGDSEAAERTLTECLMEAGHLLPAGRKRCEDCEDDECSGGCAEY
jgi:hypothetical protein